MSDNIKNNNYILSIDPALSTTGYAVIDIDTLELVHADKFITSPKESDDVRINSIVAKLFSITEIYDIKHIILEDGFLGCNPKTCIQLATLRGAIIGVFNHCNYDVKHMLPTEIRKHLECGGNAKKNEVAQVVNNIYHNNNIIQRIGPYSDKQNKNKTSDIYDAISIGIAFVKKIRGAPNV